MEGIFTVWKKTHIEIRRFLGVFVAKSSKNSPINFAMFVCPHVTAWQRILTKFDTG
jgi:hypothetical protein